MKRFLSAWERCALFRTSILVVFVFISLQSGYAGGKAGISQDTLTRMVYGWVMTELSQLPVEGARVVIQGSKEVSFTDQNGYFHLPAIDSQAQVVVQHYNHQDTIVKYDLAQRPDLHIQIKPDMSNISLLIPGDIIPDVFWDVPLSIANHPDGRTRISLREYSHHRLIVLYMWATWCKPCVETVDRWHTMWSEFPEEVIVLPIHLSREQYGRDMIERRGWDLPSLVGDSCYILDKLFFPRTTVGSTVVIRDGVFIGIADKSIDKIEEFEELLAVGNGIVTNTTDIENKGRGVVK